MAILTNRIAVQYPFPKNKYAAKITPMMLNLLSDSKSDTKKQKLSLQIIKYPVLTFTSLRTSPRGGAVPGAPETNNKVPK